MGLLSSNTFGAGEFGPATGEDTQPGQQQSPGPEYVSPATIATHQDNAGATGAYRPGYSQDPVPAAADMPAGSMGSEPLESSGLAPVRGPYGTTGVAGATPHKGGTQRQ